jgi:uncharacterized NAD(P)/FAD-binding protein YdhS
VKTVAIIGGGFCGTLAAVNLARLSPEPLRVILINCQYPTARGVAYGTRRGEHLLNVVARNMSAFPDLPSHFVDWLRTRTDFADVPLAELRDQFIPRRIYGDYLQDLLFWHMQPLGGPGRVHLEVIDDEAMDITPADWGASVALRGGDTVQAQRVLLATGNLAPSDILPPGSPKDHPAYCRNPWRGWQEKLPDAHEDVLLIGTGLTMIDVYLTLRSLGWQGKIHAISRNGLLPLSHFKGTDYAAFPPNEPWTLGLQKLKAEMEEHCSRLRAEGLNPAVIVDKLRPFSQRIWRALTVAEKQEFNRQHRTRWNVVRHRIAPTIATQIAAAQKDGGLEVIQGSISAVQAEGERLHVAIDSEKGRPSRNLNVGLLINCTGPRESFANAAEPLFRNLFQRGLIRADDVDMGIDVTPDFAVMDSTGRPSDFLYAVGPLLKGTLWETTAVPELRAQAHQIAQAFIADAEPGRADWMPMTPANLIEYCI